MSDLIKYHNNLSIKHDRKVVTSDLLIHQVINRPSTGIDTSEPNAVVIGLAPDHFNYQTLNEAFRWVAAVETDGRGKCSAGGSDDTIKIRILRKTKRLGETSGEGSHPGPDGLQSHGRDPTLVS